MMIHDIIKIKLSRAGYLPDYPPHLISDEEMCRAFLDYTSVDQPYSQDWFHDTYPMPAGFETAYQNLENGIRSAIQEFVQSSDPDRILPNWVYAYMIGSVIGPNSDYVDRHNSLVLMGLDNKDDELTPEVYQTCLTVSTQWLAKYDLTDRPPALFIEPHVIKYYRLRAAV